MNKIFLRKLKLETFRANEITVHSYFESISTLSHNLPSRTEINSKEKQFDAFLLRILCSA